MHRNKSSYIVETSIPGLLVIKKPTFNDKRGFFREVFRLKELAECGVEFKPVQMNHSFSQPRVIRGLHAENWNKLVYPISGKMFAAVVDIRPEKKSFAKVETFIFDERDPFGLFISKGLANSICVIGDVGVHYIYLVDAYYDGKDTRAISWDDPDLSIDWPVKNPILSDRDKNNPRLRDIFPEKF